MTGNIIIISEFWVHQIQEDGTWLTTYKPPGSPPPNVPYLDGINHPARSPLLTGVFDVPEPIGHLFDPALTTPSRWGSGLAGGLGGGRITTRAAGGYWVMVGAPPTSEIAAVAQDGTVISDTVQDAVPYGNICELTSGPWAGQLANVDPFSATRVAYVIDPVAGTVTATIPQTGNSPAWVHQRPNGQIVVHMGDNEQVNIFDSAGTWLHTVSQADLCFGSGASFISAVTTDETASCLNIAGDTLFICATSDLFHGVPGSTTDDGIFRVNLDTYAVAPGAIQFNFAGEQQHPVAMFPQAGIGGWTIASR